MLFSEKKERASRFFLALKMSFPFVLLVFVIAYIFRNKFLDKDDIILLLLLLIIYVYYMVYQIYLSFNITLLDHTTKTFNRTSIIKEIKKCLFSNKEANIIMFIISNIGDISERYGFRFGDFILKKNIEILQNFLKAYNYSDVPIGRYNGGYFLMIINSKENEIKHLLKTFEVKMMNDGIEDVEIKIKFSIINSSYDKNIQNILWVLFERLQNKTAAVGNEIKPDIYDRLVSKAINDKKITFKYQTIFDLKHNELKIIEIIPKINLDEWGIIPRSKLVLIINRNKQELKFDIQSFENLCKEIKEIYSKPVLFLINISTTSLRNNNFKKNIIKILEKNNYDANKFIIEFMEDHPYDEIKRFNEILLEYKKHGFKLALQKFGGKNASMEYIKYLPIDYINFDIEITKGINNLRIKDFLLSCLVLARLLKIKSLIRFVDKKETLDIFKQINIDYAQGFYISKPKIINDLNLDFKVLK